MTRFAVFFAPPTASPLARFGAAWLGHDAAGGPHPPRLPVAGFEDAALDAITAEPRRYGFHGTLKPPFALAEDRTRDSLADALERLAGSLPALVAPSLALRAIGDFLALVPSADCPGLAVLAGTCVRDLDVWRRPPDATELARRRAAGLTPLQDALLARWGYPYVFDEFRFHLTLTRRLAADERARLEPALAALTAPLTAMSLRIDDLCLFEEPAPGAPFRLTRRFALRHPE